MLGGTVELGKFKLDVHCARLRESAERVKLRHNSFFAKSIFELLRCCRLSRSLKYKTKCNNPTSQIKTSLYMAGAWSSKNCAPLHHLQLEQCFGAVLMRQPLLQDDLHTSCSKESNRRYQLLECLGCGCPKM